MKFVLYSQFGDGWFLVRRLQREGHQATVYIADPPSRRVGDGIVSKQLTPNIPPGTDCVIFDATGFGDVGQRLRRQGIPCIGGNPFDEELEIDRTLGTRIMTETGIKTPPTQTFKSMAQGRAYLATHPGHYYFKPNGDHGTDFTRNGDARSVSRFLAWVETHAKTPVTSYELQESVDGTEVSLEGWFDGSKFVGPWNSTLETKKFQAGDLGPRTGCQANVVWAYDGQTPPLAMKTVARIGPLLKRKGYVGPIDLNMILDDEGVPYGLEWSARLGFDATQAWSLLVQGDLGRQLARFARGQLDRFTMRNDLALTLRVSTPPYPIPGNALAKESAGIPLDPKLLLEPETTFLDDVMVQADGPVLAGRDGSVGCVGAVGQSWRGLCQRVLARADDLDIPSKSYRIDVVPDALARWKALAEYGYLTPSDVPVDFGDLYEREASEPMGDGEQGYVDQDVGMAPHSEVIP